VLVLVPAGQHVRDKDDNNNNNSQRILAVRAAFA
jgi:hypothetical protein